MRTSVLDDLEELHASATEGLTAYQTRVAETVLGRTMAHAVAVVCTYHGGFDTRKAVLACPRDPRFAEEGRAWIQRQAKIVARRALMPDTERTIRTASNDGVEAAWQSAAPHHAFVARLGLGEELVFYGQDEERVWVCLRLYRRVGERFTQTETDFVRKLLGHIVSDLKRCVAFDVERESLAQRAALRLLPLPGASPAVGSRELPGREAHDDEPEAPPALLIDLSRSRAVILGREVPHMRPEYLFAFYTLAGHPGRPYTYREISDGMRAAGWPGRVAEESKDLRFRICEALKEALAGTGLAADEVLRLNRQTKTLCLTVPGWIRRIPLHDRTRRCEQCGRDQRAGGWTPAAVTCGDECAQLRKVDRQRDRRQAEPVEP
jgi:hypothetical protein